MPRPKILILNSSSFGKHFPEHIEQLRAFADLERADVPIDIPAAELTELLLPFDGLILSVTPKIPGSVLEKLPRLVLIARHGIGCDNVDLETAARLGIYVSRVAGEVEKEAVAEHAIALMMSLSRCIPAGARAVKDSRWNRRAEFIGLELRGKNIGLLGFGNIGTRVADILTLGFGANVLVSDPSVKADTSRVTVVAPDELLACDILSFHCPLTPETRRFLSASRIEKVKPGIRIINTCRGELVDQEALICALKSGKVGGYATDVVEGEPVDGSHPLLQLENVIVCPHLGGYTTESLFGMGQTMVDDSRKVFVEKAVPGVLANPDVLKGSPRTWV